MIETLKGVKVISLVNATAGASCAKLLTEFGADTILIEPVKGIIYRNMVRFEDFFINGSKSVPINLRTEEGKEILYRLIEQADVMVTNYRPKALEKMKMTYDIVKEKNPRLIYACLTGYGESGPAKDDPGFDITAFWARSGAMHDMMDKFGPPIVVPSGMGDIALGENLALGICAALYNREKTGKGMRIYTSLYALGLYFNHGQIIEAQNGRKYPMTRKDPGRGMKNSFQCKDGWIEAMTLNFDKDFNNWLKAIGLEHLVGDPRWQKMSDTEGEKAIPLTEIFDEAFAKLTVEEAVARLTEADIAVAAVRPGTFCLTDPQAEANQYIRTVVTSEGKTLKVPASPIKFGEDEPEKSRKMSAFGEDTVEVLKEAGYSDAEIAHFLEIDAVRAAK